MLALARWFRPVHCLGLAGVLLLGCTSTVEKNARSAAITSRGEASIENFTEKGLTTTRIFVMKVDGVLAQPKGMKGVYPLAPGRREIIATVQWSRMSVAGLFVDAGQAKLSFEAVGATKYRLRGERTSQASATVWIEDAGTSRRVVESPVELTPNHQDVPLFVIPIPATR